MKHESSPQWQSPTVDAKGRSLAPVINGVREFSPTTHQDERGSLCEIYSDNWGFDDLPMVHSYLVTIRPGRVKGWAVHFNQVDRYFFCTGSTKLVLYDAREGSPTHGLVTEKVYSEINRTLVSVPIGVYHAVENVGATECLMFNIPSATYNYDEPDKKTLPLDNELIPYTFSDLRGY